MKSKFQMNTPFKKSCLAIGLLGLIISSSPGSLLITENFDSYTSSSTLIGQGGGGTGLSGNYLVGAGNASVNVVSSSISGYDLTYNVSGGGTISGGANSIQIVGNASTGASQDVFHRSLSSNIAGQTIYAGALVKLQHTINDSTYMYFYLRNGVPSTMGTPGFGLRDGGVNSLAAGASLPSTPTTTNAQGGSIALTDSAVHLIVASFNWNSSLSAYDSISLWLDPTATGEGSPIATATLSTPLAYTTMDTFGLGLINFSSGQTLAIDSFAVGTTFADIVPVPEPSTLALAGLGGLFIAAARRFRSKGEKAPEAA